MRNVFVDDHTANKSIIFTAPKIAEIVDFDIPQIADDEVLVKLEYSTISAGTERDDAAFPITQFDWSKMR